MSRSRTIRTGACVLGVLACAGLLPASGCSTTDHDEYFRIRSIVVQATPGDGSMIASNGGRGDSMGKAREAMLRNRSRDSISDQRVSLE